MSAVLSYQSIDGDIVTLGLSVDPINKLSYLKQIILETKQEYYPLHIRYRDNWYFTDDNNDLYLSDHNTMIHLDPRTCGHMVSSSSLNVELHQQRGRIISAIADHEFTSSSITSYTKYHSQLLFILYANGDLLLCGIRHYLTKLPGKNQHSIRVSKLIMKNVAYIHLAHPLYCDDHNDDMLYVITADCGIFKIRDPKRLIRYTFVIDSSQKFRWDATNKYKLFIARWQLSELHTITPFNNSSICSIINQPRNIRRAISLTKYYDGMLLIDDNDRLMISGSVKLYYGVRDLLNPHRESDELCVESNSQWKIVAVNVAKIAHHGDELLILFRDGILQILYTGRRYSEILATDIDDFVINPTFILAHRSNQSLAVFKSKPLSDMTFPRHCEVLLDLPKATTLSHDRDRFKVTKPALF